MLYDCVQYTKNDWRNRNQIKSKNGVQWLTIPVSIKSSTQLINETEVANNLWVEKHMKTLAQTYSKAKFYGEYVDELRDCYGQVKSLTKISEINFIFIQWINKKLGITTKLHSASDFQLADDRIERLVSICQQLDANFYLSGPAAKDYLNEMSFSSQGITVEWMDYCGYPEYPQFGDEFQHGVSVLDLLFHTGNEAINYFNKKP